MARKVDLAALARGFGDAVSEAESYDEMAMMLGEDEEYWKFIADTFERSGHQKAYDSIIGFIGGSREEEEEEED
jgi:hypothetical protein